ncbi:hypothetical protein J5X84_31540 [Streptosporangiaceae bacterium NEAU-GS5]|nr:hypothetical protein [Streptosporangiaceae bacterium NEAU-GS5]
MNGALLITTLVANLADVRTHLDDDQSRELDQLLARLGAAGEAPVTPEDTAELDEIAIEIADLIEPLLPREHPVRLSITTAMRWQTGAVVDPGPWTEALSRLDARVLRGTTPARLAESARRWLRAAPSHHPSDVPDGYLPEIIQLDTDQGDLLVPAFQFDEEGRAHALVLMINAILEVDDDPWGVADWWLGENAWLGAAPADLLGTGRDDDLFAAATAEIERI